MRYLIIIVFFLSCHNLSKDNNVLAQSANLKVSINRFDTLAIVRYTIMTKPEIFETAFFKGTHVKVDTVNLEFYSVGIGKINIESGKLIACDPIVMRDIKPFAQTFPIGQFPVQIGNR